ncbi:hypothetical protein B0H13DRAFT_1919397 [Mycena leptocephala]|nr:hypothetical protein B0H13DRAFT_1919397 [Mycena leptocephala]
MQRQRGGAGAVLLLLHLRVAVMWPEIAKESPHRSQITVREYEQRRCGGPDEQQAGGRSQRCPQDQIPQDPDSGFEAQGWPSPCAVLTYQPVCPRHDEQESLVAGPGKIDKLDFGGRKYIPWPGQGRIGWILGSA